MDLKYKLFHFTDETSYVVIPTQVGVQKSGHWIPACAGMTIFYTHWHELKPGCAYTPIFLYLKKSHYKYYFSSINKIRTLDLISCL